MENSLLNSINQTLLLIEDVNIVLKNLKKAGENENSLSIRQYQHLLKRHTNDLLNDLEKLHLPVEFHLINS